MNNLQKGFIAPLLIALIALLLIGGGAYMYTQKKQENPPAVENATLPQANPPVTENVALPQATSTIPATTKRPTSATLQPEDVTAKIIGNFSARYKLLNIDENNQPENGEVSIRLGKGSPAYKVEGFNYYVSYDGGSTLVVMPYNPNPTDYHFPKAADKALRTEMASVYTDFGLVKKESRGGSSDGPPSEDVYMGRGLICTVNPPTSPTSLNWASCGLVNAYKEAATRLQPFANVLPDFGQATILAGLKISDSQVSGYQKATLSQGFIGDGGSVAHFYKKNTGAWVYFRSTQSTGNCSDYNTPDLRNAFKGDACYDNNNQSTTVQ